MLHWVQQSHWMPIKMFYIVWSNLWCFQQRSVLDLRGLEKPEERRVLSELGDSKVLEKYPLFYFWNFRVGLHHPRFYASRHYLIASANNMQIHKYWFCFQLHTIFVVCLVPEVCPFLSLAKSTFKRLLVFSTWNRTKLKPWFSISPVSFGMLTVVYLYLMHRGLCFQRILVSGKFHETCINHKKRWRKKELVHLHHFDSFWCFQITAAFGFWRIWFRADESRNNFTIPEKNKTNFANNFKHVEDDISVIEFNFIFLYGAKAFSKSFCFQEAGKWKMKRFVFGSASTCSCPILAAEAAKSASCWAGAGALDLNQFIRQK